MDRLLSILERINGLLWGPGMLVLLVGVGVYFTMRTRWFQVRRFPQVIKRTLLRVREKGEGKGITSAQALFTALSGTLGTGSMAGVATAITLGGPGAMFWMALSALVGMMTKYAEIVLAVHYRKEEGMGYLGGPMVTLERGLGMPRAGALYALFGLLASFGVGNIVQANALSQVVHQAAGTPPLAIGIVAALLAGMAIIGGVKRVARVTEKVVPIMSLMYIAGGLAVLMLRLDELPGAISAIFGQALSPAAFLGGAAGAGARAAIRYGVSRGVFSNEAGMGSAAIAHASADCRHPVDQGLWGILEVSIDTLLVCTMSGLVVLAAGPWKSDLTGAALLSEAFFSTLGHVGRWIVTLSLAAFAFATFLGWSHYGEQCLRYLGGQRVVPAYRAAFVCLIAVGAVMRLDIAWALADVFNGLMILPNLFSVILLSPVVLQLTRERLGR